jgi:hypothetical protein
MVMEPINLVQVIYMKVIMYMEKSKELEYYIFKQKITLKNMKVDFSKMNLMDREYIITRMET